MQLDSRKQIGPGYEATYRRPAHIRSHAQRIINYAMAPTFARTFASIVVSFNLKYYCENTTISKQVLGFLCTAAAVPVSTLLNIRHTNPPILTGDF